MIFSESPKALAMDGTLAAWALFVVIHGAEVITAVLTIALLVIRLMIAWRQWKAGK